MRFGVIIADPPWVFGDDLGARGAAANYQLLTLDALCALPVNDVRTDVAVAGVWCPKSMYSEGTVVLSSWGFRPVGHYTWRKTTKTGKSHFGMGRLVRATEEVALLGVRGSVYPHMVSRSERDHGYAPVGKHSEKPTLLHDMFDRMFPDWPKLELFARRDVGRSRWTCVGNECPSTLGEDIRTSLARLKALEQAA